MKRTRKGSGVLLPNGVIQHRGWSTTKSDPGENCPKCGAGMCYSGDDDTVFCRRSMDGTDCDFQYSFTEAERRANEKREADYWDDEARKDTAKYVEEHGRLVFGEVDPNRFVLPSEQERRRKNAYSWAR